MNSLDLELARALQRRLTSILAVATATITDGFPNDFAAYREAVGYRRAIVDIENELKATLESLIHGSPLTQRQME